MTRRTWSVVAMLAIGSQTAVRAQDPPEPDHTTVAPAQPGRVGVAGPTAPLSLDEAIRLALESNTDVVVTRLQRDLARQDVHAAEGAFDPRLQPIFSYEQATLPVTSLIGGASNGSISQRDFAGSVQLNGLSPWLGGRFSIDFNANRLDTNNLFQRLNPQFPSSTGVTYTQPLGRGLRFDAERRQILIARRVVDLSDAQVSHVLMDQLLAVEDAYWDLAFARRNVDIQQAALAQAHRQVDSNERQATQGTLAPIDVVEAATQVANFEQEVATAQQALTDAEIRLKTLMLSDRRSPFWDRPIEPDPLIENTLPPMSLDSAIAMALERRPELDESDATLAQNAIDRRFYSDRTRPQLDLIGRYALAGLAGTVVEQPNDPIGDGTTIPSFFSGGLGSSLAGIGARRFPTASVQLQMDLPLRNRTARANLARTDIQGQQLARRRQQLEQAIAADVRAALQAVESSHRRLASAGSAARNAQAQYDSERRRFESGLGTLFLVLERQTALVTAQARELRARADLNQAVALMHRAVGNTLQRHGVQL